MLSLKKISKEFVKSKTLLDELNLELSLGKSYALVGSSGSGKSTLLNIISGLERADKGEVIFDGQDISNFSDSAMSNFRLLNIGIVFQFFNFLPSLTLLENISLPAQIALNKNSKTKALNLAKKLKIKNVVNKYPFQVSGGELQRAAIARALINDPKLLLADEPTGNLDRSSSEQVMSLLNSITKEIELTTFIVSHDIELAKDCDFVLELFDGKVKRN